MSRPNHGPRLRPNKDGIYYITWSEGGRSKRLSTRTGNLPEAQKVLGGFLMEAEKQTDLAGLWTVGQIIKFYDENHIETDVIDKARQRKAMDYISRQLGDDSFIHELSAEDFTAYRKARKRAQTVKRKNSTKTRVVAGANDATIRRELNTFLAAANFCVRNRKIENRHVPVIELPDHNAGRDKYLEKDQFEHLLAMAQPQDATRLSQEYRLIALAVGTYRRRRALETLQWFKVDLKNGIIDFRRPGEPETRKRRGIAVIPDWLLPILQRAYDEKISEYVMDDPHPQVRDIRRVADAAGFPWVTAHTLRHTGGTWAAQDGASMWQIAGAMGCTVATAERNYLHHSPEHLRGVVNRVQVDISAAAKG